MNRVRANTGEVAVLRAPALLMAMLLAAMLSAMGLLAFLSTDLPEDPGLANHFPATGLHFAFGYGHPTDGRMLVDGFADGYALLSSGPVSISADALRVLSYTWLPSGPSREAAFFWRRGDDPGNVLRTEVTVPGEHLLDLATEPDWRGVITEFGFLVAGTDGETTEIGETVLIPDSLRTRLQLAVQSWTSFEEWTQKSINMLYGGDYRQLASLPVLVIAWVLITLFLMWFYSKVRKDFVYRPFFITAGLLFLLAWVVLDIRWSVNNIHQLKHSLQTQWQLDNQQQLSIGLDGDIYRYIQRLKNEVLGQSPSRILILGDENAIDYYLLRAKYHLLPHSVDVRGRFRPELQPDKLDYIIFFGQPKGISKVPGWGVTWQRALVKVDSGEWGTVFRLK